MKTIYLLLLASTLMAIDCREDSGDSDSGGNSGNSSTTYEEYLYVMMSDNTQDQIYGYDLSSGVPNLLSGLPIDLDGASDNPHDFAAHPDGDIFFMSEYSGEAVSVWSVDANGSLTQVGSDVTLLDSPTELAVSEDGDYLYVALAGPAPATLQIFSIASNGSLSELAGSPFDTDIDQFDIMDMTVNGDYLYILDKFDNVIVIYDIASDGSLSNRREVATTDRPAMIRAHDNLMFVADESATAGGVSVYVIGSSGGLTAVSGNPYVEASGGTGFDASVAITDDGSYAYYSVDASSEVRGYSIASDGTLTELSGSPFSGSATIGKDMAYYDGYLYVNSFQSDVLDVFSVGSDGALSLESSLTVPTASTGGPGAMLLLSVPQ